MPPVYPTVGMGSDGRTVAATVARAEFRFQSRAENPQARSAKPLTCSRPSCDPPGRPRPGTSRPWHFQAGRPRPGRPRAPPNAAAAAEAAGRSDVAAGAAAVAAAALPAWKFQGAALPGRGPSSTVLDVSVTETSTGPSRKEKTVTGNGNSHDGAEPYRWTTAVLPARGTSQRGPRCAGHLPARGTFQREAPSTGSSSARHLPLEVPARGTFQREALPGALDQGPGLPGSRRRGL